MYLMMNLFEELENWTDKLQPILIRYKGRKHPLNYQNTYQLLVMVLLSAQDSDANINALAPIIFHEFPNMESLASAKIDILLPYISTVENFNNKATWLLELAQTIQKDENIPLTMKELITLKGIGRKSANVILRETSQPPVGIIVDLHVIRVAPRIGLTNKTKDGLKLEKQLMLTIPKSIWNDIGMALSFLGREICRPQPKCNICPINKNCSFYNS